MRTQLRASRTLSAGIVSALLAFTPAAHAQGYSEGQSLGDASRAQAEIHRQSPVEPKRYVETGTPLPTAVPSADPIAAPKSNPDPAAPPTTPAKHETPEKLRSENAVASPARSLLDRPRNDDDEDNFLVVPAGTEIEVEIAANVQFPALSYEGKVIVPVRSGFATAIPALSRAGVQVFARHYGYQDNPGAAYAYFEAVELTDLTVDGVTYAVQTARAPKFGTNTSPSETTFTLLAPLKIRR